MKMMRMKMRRFLKIRPFAAFFIFRGNSSKNLKDFFGIFREKLNA